MLNKKDSSISIFIVFALYFVPIFSWIALNHLFNPYQISFYSGAIGIILLCFGSVLLFLAIQKVAEIPLSDPVPVAVTPLQVFSSPEEPLKQEEDKTDCLEEEMRHLQQEVEKSGLELLECHRQIEEKDHERADLLQQMQALKQGLVEQDEKYRIRIDELELTLHQKQQMVEQLDTQIHDLRYEIKTLLQLTEVDYSKFVMEPVRETVGSQQPSHAFQGVVKREEEAKLLLKSCLDLAQRISSGYRSGAQGLSSSPSALDMRRLIDALKEESGALILLYDPKEKKMLYASKESKNLLGWAPETLAHDFQEIADEGIVFWERAVEQLETMPHTSIVLGLKTKGGDELAFHAHLGVVSSGIFRSYAVGILFASD